MITNFKTFTIQQQYLNEQLLLESINIKSLLNDLKNSVNKKHISKILVTSLLSIFTLQQTINFINKSDQVVEKDKTELLNVLEQIASKNDKFKDPLELQISDNIIEEIKKIEKLTLKAYYLKDRKITIGYGHAEDINRTKFEIGQVINKEYAEKLLKNDLKFAEKGLKRIFKEWKRQGIDIKITQNQYDSMISMIFNMGIQRMRESKFIQKIKQNKFDEAAELILVTAIGTKYKKGLTNRRMLEHELFTKDLV